MQAEKTRLLREQFFDKVLDDMTASKYTLAEFLDYVFNPETKLKSDWRWRGFFLNRPVIERIFGYWTSSKYPATTHATVHEWAASLIAAKTSTEAQSITSSGILTKSKKVVNEQFFLGYSLAGLTATLRGMAPTAFHILDAFSSTARQLRQNSAAGLRKKEILRGSAALSLLRAASQYNNYVQAVNSAYLAATGASRQHFAVFGALGSSLGYTSVVSSNKAAASTINRPRPPGLLTLLSNACNATSRSIASSGLFVVVYDNINMMVRVSEQILGRKNAQENGTCTTLIPLHDTQPADLLTSSLDTSILNAPPLRIEHLLLTDVEAEFHAQNMVHTILRIIVRHGGPGFKKWQKDLDAMQPKSSETIDVHKTPIHPLPSMEIDENSITGNIEVMSTINQSLGLNADDPEYIKYIKIVAGDQLTIARQRSILTVRLCHESGAHSWRNIFLMPGLFHAKIADCHGLLETHFGKPNADSLDDYSSSVNSWAAIVGHAKDIYSSYADPDLVQELQEQRIPNERKQEAEAKAANNGKKPDGTLPHVKKGDMVFENAILFFRDALLTREFTDAVKAGDSGRIVLILRMWVFSYQGSGRSKYAHEMLHLLHNLICVWTKELRHVIMMNWLLNPTGKVNSFVEIDLIQEHLNFWIKKIYKADGDSHSWDWLALISPCVDILRSLATRIHTDLGARQGSKHTIPNLEEDIAALMDSLDEQDVYTLQHGRVLDDDEKPVPDILSVGMAALTHGASTTPLAEFNQQFEILRARCGLTPVADLLSLLDRDSSPLDESPAQGFPSPPVDSAAGGNERQLDAGDDLFLASPTLMHLTAADVSLDMDVCDWSLDSDDEESECKESGDDSDGSDDPY
ncbi:hypothetical protein C8R44DRAFT_829613 [Mycena epipterygia]|nr:hypothetical protein C8R44DRAFT_829613 [Mycena epipterygia]